MIAAQNSTSSFYQNSLDQMTRLRQSAERLQTQVSTGDKLTRGSDDPVASSRLRALAREDRMAAIDETNANAASTGLQSASTAIEDMTDLLIRARELAVQAGSETTGPDGREAIATEIDELRTSLLGLANMLDSSGRPLFGGQNAAPAFVEGAGGVISYAGSAATDTVEIGLGVSVDRGVTGPNVVNFSNDGAATDAFAFLASFTADIRGAAADPAAAARDALSGFDAGIDTMSRTQTVLGARLAWIDTVQFGAIARDETRAEEQSELGDTDLAEAITQLQQTLTVLEASQASFARLTNLSLFDSI